MVTEEVQAGHWRVTDRKQSQPRAKKERNENQSRAARIGANERSAPPGGTRTTRFRRCGCARVRVGGDGGDGGRDRIGR